MFVHTHIFYASYVVRFVKIIIVRETIKISTICNARAKWRVVNK